MRKKYNILFLLVLPFLISSCDEWLSVEPEDEISEEDLYSNGQGFRHVLNGIYYAMGNQTLYGEHLSWGIVDALGQCYDCYDAPNGGRYLGRYAATAFLWDHYELKPAIENLWASAYNAVANCNNLIQNAQKADSDIFAYKEREKNLLLGEALALRAFIQFDILRLFAPSPAMSPGNNVYVPYVSVYPSYVSNRLTVDSCLSCITEDLKQARKYLWKSDSAVNFSTTNRFESTTSTDEFFIKFKRGYRLNYYAVTALLARVSLYAQKQADAYAYAKELIDVQNKFGYFEFDTYNISYGDIKLYSDVLWGVESVDLIEYMNAFNQLTAPDPYDQYYIKVAQVNKNFFGKDISGSMCNDVRYNYWLYDLGDGRDFRFVKYEKYDSKDDEAKISNNLVPLIRMSEVYYIAAEAIYQENLDEAKQYLLTVKDGRDLRDSDISVQEVRAASEDNFMDLLIEDARREWIGEGQIFFMYKRLGKSMPSMDGVSIVLMDDAVLAPIPDTETNINR
ncbi:MAG: RagB/SusD family nutrient uptake outer membrane protein [Marinifilaceae bacterium]|nr:RagB/SusD family nutrient uptake outer membrane protein [Marinifilaceae bacterium]